MSAIQNAFAIVKDSEWEQNLRKTDKAWEKFRTSLLDPAEDMNEEKRKAYERKIRAKLKSGKRLTSQELSYLRMHNPDLYKIAMRVEMARQALRNRLKSCKSKEEVQQAIFGQMEVIKAMREAGDPATEYMEAMADHEIKTLQESSAYARLPERTEDTCKKKKQQIKGKDPFEEQDKKERQQEGETYFSWTLLLQGRFQCDKIRQLTAEIL
ncbi:MAG: hypothetical protein K2K70_08780 [Lachnospiraceae bacterium]|nr:hypothetical protein [Lachnospiraceae bacterium]